MRNPVTAAPTLSAVDEPNGKLKQAGCRCYLRADAREVNHAPRLRNPNETISVLRTFRVPVGNGVLLELVGAQRHVRGRSYFTTRTVSRENLYCVTRSLQEPVATFDVIIWPDAKFFAPSIMGEYARKHAFSCHNCYSQILQLLVSMLAAFIMAR